MKIAIDGRLALALRNIFRHRMRTLATLAAISLGVASLILAGGFVQDSLIQLGEATIHSQTGHLQLTQEGFRASRSRASESFLIANPEGVKSRIVGDPGVELAAARINFAGMLNNGKRDLGIVGDGIEPDLEARVGTFLHYIEGRALTDGDDDGVVVGEGVARTLDLRIGDRVTLLISLAQGAVNTQEFRLVGVFQSFSKAFDARAVRISLAATRQLLDTNAAHLVVVTLKRTDDTPRVLGVLRKTLSGEGIEVMSWTELSDFYEKTVELYRAQFGVLRLIILVMVLLSVTNSVNMTLFERTREFGTLAALGDSKARLFQLIMTESALLGLFGAVTGVMTGCLLAWVISAVGIPMPPPPNSNIGYNAVIRLIPGDVLGAGLIGLVATILASVLPARRASRLPVVDALRHGT